MIPTSTSCGAFCKNCVGLLSLGGEPIVRFDSKVTVVCSSPLAPSGQNCASFEALSIVICSVAEARQMGTNWGYHVIGTYIKLPKRQKQNHI